MVMAGAYKTIIEAHNAKAQTDSRYKTINPEQGLEVGQLIWIPLPLKSNTGITSTKSSKPPIQTLDESKLVSDYSLPKPAVQSTDGKATDKKRRSGICGDFTYIKL